MVRSSHRLRARGFTQRYIVQDGEIKSYRQFHTDINSIRVHEKNNKHEVSNGSEVSDENSDDNDNKKCSSRQFYKDVVVYSKRDRKKHVLLNALPLTYGRDKQLINIFLQNKQQIINRPQERDVDFPRWGRKKNIRSLPQRLLKLPRWGNRRLRNTLAISTKQESRKSRWKMLDDCLINTAENDLISTAPVDTFQTDSKCAKDCGELSTAENRNTLQFQQYGIPSSLPEDQTFLVDHGSTSRLLHPVQIFFVDSIVNSRESASSSQVQLSNQSIFPEPSLKLSSNKQPEQERDYFISTPRRLSAIRTSMRACSERITGSEQKDEISKASVEKPKKKKHRPKVIRDRVKKAMANKKYVNGQGNNGSQDHRKGKPSKREMGVNINAIAKLVIRKKRTTYERNRRISFKHMLTILRNINTENGPMKGHKRRIKRNKIQFYDLVGNREQESTNTGIMYSHSIIPFQSPSPLVGNKLTLYTQEGRHISDVNEITMYNHQVSQQKCFGSLTYKPCSQHGILDNNLAMVNKDCTKLLLEQQERNNLQMVIYNQQRDIVESKFTKPRVRAKVQMDIENERIWPLLALGGIPSAFEDHEYWTKERTVMRHRVDIFIQRMQNVQGHRCFSPWKGSIVDSVVGAFLTQNVSDHLSSSAFMSVVSRFPAVQRNKKDSNTYETNKCYNTDLQRPIDVDTPEPETLKTTSLSDGSGKPVSTTDIWDCNLQRTAPLESEVLVEDLLKISSTANAPRLSNCLEASNNYNNGCTTNVESCGRILLTESSSEYNSGEGSTIVSHETLHGKRFQEEGLQTETYNATEVSLHNYAPESGEPGESTHKELCPFPCAQVEKMIKVMSHDAMQEDPFYRVEYTNSEQRATACQINTHDISCFPTQDYGSLNSRTDDSYIGHDYVTVDQKAFNGVRGSSVRRVLFASKNNDSGVTASVRQTISVREKLNDQNQNTEPHLHRQEHPGLKMSVPEDDEKADKLKPYMPGSDSNEKTSKKRRIIGGIERAHFEENQKGRKRNHKQDWEPMRHQTLGLDNNVENGKQHERDEIYLDTVDWEAVRQVSVADLADTIKERGMHHVLSGRIKNLLNRVYEDHGSIDLEWLRKLSPENARAYLMSIRGLGVKSVECIRLLTLHHVAFPVDVNVGRICVRLGWVPIEPLPEELQLHLLELYPVQETIQKYLWPRLCTLDQKILYEFHYQLITFGKVFCTKSKPNCNACPMRTECKHFASACSSAKLHLTGPKDQSYGKTISNLLPSSSQNAIQNFAEGSLSAAPLISEINYPSMHNICNQQTFFVEEPLSPERDDNELMDIEEFSIYNSMDDFTQDLLSAEDCTIPPPLFNDDHNNMIQGGAFQQTNKEKDKSCDVDPLESKTQKNFPICPQNVKIPNYQRQVPGTEEKTENAIVSVPTVHIPAPKLKNEYRLRTVHYVYELPDDHYLLEKLDVREKDDPCFYLLAIWSPGETPELGKEWDAAKQSSSVNNNDTVPATLLIPCRTAMHGSFPLNGTYFQVNEVFADHESSLRPFLVPRSEIWSLPRRFVYFGTSIPNIFRGLSIEDIQSCFLQGYVCVRGFDRQSRAPKPLSCRLHFPISKQVKIKKGEKIEKSES